MVIKILIFAFLYQILDFQSANGYRVYTAYKHAKTGRYLSSDGYLQCKLNSNYQLFSPKTVAPGEVVIFAEKWMKKKNNSTQIVLDLEYGCHVNSSVIIYEYKGGQPSNQVWITNEDEQTIGTKCNEDWRLTITDDYKVVVVDKNSVPFEDTIFVSIKTPKIIYDGNLEETASNGCYNDQL